MLKTDDLTLVLTNRQKIFWPEQQAFVWSLSFLPSLRKAFLRY